MIKEHARNLTHVFTEYLSLAVVLGEKKTTRERI